MLFIFFYHCDGLPFFSFCTLSRKYCLLRLLRTLFTLFLRDRYNAKLLFAIAFPRLVINALKYGVIHGRSDEDILTLYVGPVSSIAELTVTL